MSATSLVVLIIVGVASLEALQDCYSQDECEQYSRRRGKRNYQPCLSISDRENCFIPARCITSVGLACMNDAMCLPPDPTIMSCYYPYCCQCPQGFTGEQCQWNSPATCSNNACLNGGKCSLSGDGLFCRCPAGYGGWHCEIRNPCSRYPCPANVNCAEHSRGRKGRSCAARDGTVFDDDI